MKGLVVVFSLAVTTGVFAQTVTRSFGSVVFPGGTSATTPGITRNFGSVVFPGSAPVPAIRGASPIVGTIPPVGAINPFPVNGVNGINGQNFRHLPGSNGGGGRNSRGQTYVYAYPVFVGGGYGGAYDNGGYPPPDQAPPQQQQPPQNITVIYPPAQHATPMMIQPVPDADPYASGQRQGATIYQAPPGGLPVTVEPPQPESADLHYLIAFKDHIIYSAVAYWVDGDTLHYFTSGNTHNQASVSLVDRELTERLNRELGIDFRLPPAK